MFKNLYWELYGESFGEELGTSQIIKNFTVLIDNKLLFYVK